VSRFAKVPIPIPSGVTVEVGAGRVQVKGPKGRLEMPVPHRIRVTKADSTLRVERPDDEKVSKALHGLVHRLLTNMLRGVTQGFSKQLEIQGVGYRAQVQGDKVELALGFSHPIIYRVPEGIRIETPAPTSIIVTGIDKQKVGQVAAELRAFRPPEPYKGKGVRYVGEYVRRKVGKTGVKQQAQ
jgi:large subunit ribosomal protein L6